MNTLTFDEIVSYREDKEMYTSAEFTAVVTEYMMERFHEICGDENPIHVDAGYACANGFKDRVVYGMLTASFYSTLAGMYLPGKYCILQKIESSFHQPVYIGDSLDICGRVKDKQESIRRIIIEAEIKNQSGARVSKALLYAGVMK